MSELQKDFRADVSAHFSHFIYPFMAELLSDGKGGRDLTATTRLEANWEHWLAGATDAELTGIVDDSYFFLKHLRRLIFPEFVVQTLGGADNLQPPDASRVAGVLKKATLGNVIRKLQDSPEVGDYSERAILRIRYSDLVSKKLNRFQTQMDGITYSANVDYFDVCLFPDCRGILVARISDIAREDGATLATEQLGRLLRQLKGIQHRQRYVVGLSNPKFDGGMQSWATVLDHILADFTAQSVTQATREGSDSRFHKMSYLSVSKRDALLRTSEFDNFSSNLTRMLFEMTTGHDTTDSQERPSPKRISEIETGMVDQWENFGALAFWDDATFYILDRTNTTDPPTKSNQDNYARITFPRQVENSYLWLYILAEYQRITLSDYTIRLVQLGLNDYRDLDMALSVTNEYLRFRNLYWFRNATSSQFGIAIHGSMVRLEGLDEMMHALDSQFELVTDHFRMEHDQVEAVRSQATNLLLSILGIVGVPMGVVATVMANPLASAPVLLHLSARDAWLVFLGSLVVLLAIVGGWIRWSSGHEVRKRDAHRKISGI